MWVQTAIQHTHHPHTVSHARSTQAAAAAGGCGGCPRALREHRDGPWGRGGLRAHLGGVVVVQLLPLVVVLRLNRDGWGRHRERERGQLHPNHATATFLCRHRQVLERRCWRRKIVAVDLPVHVGNINSSGTRTRTRTHVQCTSVLVY